MDEASLEVADELSKWVFFLRKAQDYSADELRELLPRREFQEAIQIIETIAQKTEDRTMFDQREKAIRDYDWAMWGAREEGREEGLELGKLVGQAQLLQSLLGDVPSTDEDLFQKNVDDLVQMIVGMQSRLRSRDT